MTDRSHLEELEYQKKRAELKADLDDAARRLDDARMDLSSLESTPIPEYCFIPFEIAEDFRCALERAEIPYRYFGPPTRTSDQDPPPSLTAITNIPVAYIEAMMTVRLGHDMDGGQIVPACIYANLTADSVFAFCKGFTEPEPRDAYWAARRAFDEACRAYDALTVPASLKAEEEKRVSEMLDRYAAEAEAIEDDHKWIVEEAERIVSRCSFGDPRRDE